MTELSLSRQRARLRAARRRRFVLEGLEERLAPAVVADLSIVGTTLVYTGRTTANRVVLSTDASGNVLTFSEGTGTIRSTVPGFGSGAASTGAVSSRITGITVNLPGASNQITLGAAGAPLSLPTRGLTLTAATIATAGPVTTASFTETAKVFYLNHDLSTNPAVSPVGGNAVFNGLVNVGGTNPNGPTVQTSNVLDGNLTVNGSIVGSETLTLIGHTGTTLVTAGRGNVTITGSVGLGAASGPTLNVQGNNVAVGQVVVISSAAGNPGHVTITGQNNVTLNGNLISTGSVAVSANFDGQGAEGFRQTAGGIFTTSSTAIPDVLLQVNQPTGGAGSAVVRTISAGPGGNVSVNVNNPSSGGAVVDGLNTGAANVSIPPSGPLGGTFSLLAGAGAAKLNTSVANLVFTLPIQGAVQDLVIRNAGQPLEIMNSTTNGNVVISNNRQVMLGDSFGFFGTLGLSAGGNVTVTTTNAANVVINQVSADTAAGVVTINAAGAIVATGTIFANPSPGIVAPNVVLNAARGIGADAAVVPAPAFNQLLQLSATFNPAVTLTAVTGDGGVALTSQQAFTINKAVAQAGGVALVAQQGTRMTINGPVFASGGGAVLFDSGDLYVNAGPVSSDTGAIAFNSTKNLVVAGPVVVSTAGTFAIGSAGLSPSSITLVGSVSATGDLSIYNASSGLGSTLTISGKVSSGGALSIAVGTSADPATIKIGGKVCTTGAGSLSITSGSPTSLLLSGLVSSTADVQIGDAASAQPIGMTLGGTISATGNVTINGTSTGDTTITVAGPITAGGSVAIAAPGAAIGDTTITVSGPITGASVGLGGGTGNDTFVVSGPLTATTGGVSVACGAGTNAVTITGVLKAASPTGTTIDGGGGINNYSITPSLYSALSFINGTGGATVHIKTALSNLVAAPPPVVTSGTVTFTTASKLKSWTFSGGSYTIVPSN